MYQIDQMTEVSPKAFDHLEAAQEVSLQQKQQNKTTRNGNKNSWSTHNQKTTKIQ